MPAIEVAPPTLGQPGQQVRLTWAAEPGRRYLVERSTDLLDWRQRSVVEADGTSGEWEDAEVLTERMFYRIAFSGMEVIGLDAPVIRQEGDELLLFAKFLPEGSSFVLFFEGGEDPMYFDIEASDENTARISFPSLTSVGGEISGAEIRSADGTTLFVIDQRIDRTESGRARDVPGWDPPGAPIAAAQDHNASRSNKTSAVAGPGFGGGGTGGGPSIAAAQDHNASRSNKTSAIAGPGFGGGGTGGGPAIAAAQDHNASRSNKTSAIAGPGFGGGGTGGGPAIAAAQDHNASRSNKTSAIAGPGFGGGGTGGGPAIAAAQDHNASRSNKTSAIIAPDFDFDGDPEGEIDLSAGTASRSAGSKRGYDYYQSSSSMRGGGESALYQAKSLRHGGGTMSHDNWNSPSAAAYLPGEVAFSEVDLLVPAQRGPALAWVRTYRSKVPVSSGHGDGWDFAYSIRAEPLPLSAGSDAPRVALSSGTGHVDIFRRMPDGTYRADGLFREGRFVEGRFELTFSAGGRWNFHGWNEALIGGKIESIVDRHGNALHCSYDPSGRLLQIADDLGKHLTLTWNAANRITRVTDHTGRYVAYGYHRAGLPGGLPGQLHSVSSPLYEAQSSQGQNALYTYSTGKGGGPLDGNLLTVVDAAGRLLAAFTHSDEADPLHPAFDTCARIDRFGEGGEDSLATALTIAPLPPGEQPLNGYRLLENDEEGRLNEYIYDRMHRLVRHRAHTGGWLSGHPVYAGTDPVAPKLRAEDPDFFETRFEYNADHLIARCLLPDGTEIRARHGRDWNPQASPRMRGDTHEISMLVPGRAALQMGMQYAPNFGTDEASARGNPIAGLNIKAGGSNFPHNPGKRTVNGFGFGPFVQELRADSGQVWTWGHDAHGNTISHSTPINGFFEEFAYNAFGQQIRHTELDGAATYTTAFEYDDLTGLLVSIVGDPDLEGTGETLALTMILAYDGLGRPSSITDADGHEWLYVWNARNQVVRVESPVVGDHPATAARIRAFHTYDPAGYLVRSDLEHRDASGASVSENPFFTTFFEYSPRGLRTRVASEARPVNVPPGVLSPVGLGLENFDYVEFTYSPSGLPVASVRHSGSLILHARVTHDERRLPFLTGYGDPAEPGEALYQTDYDALGAPVRQTRIENGKPGPAHATTYDALHRVTSVTGPLGSRTLYAYGSDGFITVSHEGPGGICPEGDCENILLSQSLFLGGFPRWNEAPPDALGFELGAENVIHIGSASSGGGRSKARSHNNPMFQGNDMAGEMLVLTSFAPPGPSGGGYAFKTTPLWTDVLAQSESLTESRFIPGQEGSPVSETTVFHFTPGGRLQSITQEGDLILGLTYDRAGRLASSTDGATTLSYTRNGNGQSSVCGVTNHLISHGGGGDPTDDLTGTLVHTRDPLGRVVAVTDGQGNTQEFAYDSLGRATRVTEPAGLARYFRYDGSAGLVPWTWEESIQFPGDDAPVVKSRAYMRGGRLLSTTDAYGHLSAFTYDTRGRLIRTDFADGTHESIEITGIRHWQKNRKDGAIITYEMDDHFRLIGRSITQTPVGLAPVPDKLWRYDGLGRILRIEEGDDVMDFVWDSIGNQISASHQGTLVHREFGLRGRRALTYPGGTRLLEDRNAAGLVTAIHLAGENAADEPVMVAQFSYLGRRLHQMTQANGITSTFLYRSDGASPLQGAEPDYSFNAEVGVLVHNDEGALLHQVRTVHDRNQRPVLVETRYGGDPMGALRQSHRTYDRLGNLATELVLFRAGPGLPLAPESSRAWTYDLEGLRLSASGDTIAGDYTQSAALPPGHQQLGQYTAWPAGPLDWNTSGGLVALPHPTTPLALHYDATGFLLGADDPGTGTALMTRTRDPLGRPSARAVNNGNGTTGNRLMIHDGDACILDLDTVGSSFDLHVVHAGMIVAQFGGASAGWTYPVASLIPHLPPPPPLFPRASGDEPGTGRGSVGHGPAVPSTNSPSTVPMPTVKPRPARAGVILDESGLIVETIEHPPFAMPRYLLPGGSPQNLAGVGPIRWMSPEVLSNPETRLLHFGRETFHPDPAVWVGPPKRPWKE